MRTSLKLVSNDTEVLTVCRELMAEFSEVDWHVLAPSSIDNIRGADLCLWDCKPGTELPASPQWGTRFFVMLRRKDLPAFQEAHPEAAASVVLKPITRSILRGVFAQAVSAKTRHAGETDAAAPNFASVRADRDTLLQSLIEANLRLQEYDQERTNFLTRAVHDFRAPLTAINGYCGLLMEDHMGALNTEQREVIRRMGHSARRLARMANAMFHLSVGKRLEIKPNTRPADIRDSIDQALHEVAQFTDEKHIQISLDLLPCPGTLSFDTGQIEQTLMNLLDNACKFTPRFGAIEIKGYPYFWERRLPNISLEYGSDRREQQLWSANSYRLDIRDSGPGIHPEHLEAIFEEYTLYPAVQDRSGGGLGLAVCKMIIGQHQGRIWAENGPSGAIFSIVLPFQHSVSTNGHAARSAAAGALTASEGIS